MSKGTTSYRIKDEQALYYLTFSTVEWIDVFTRKRYKDIVVDSLAYCQKEKGLELYSWVLMSNHMHMVVKASEGNKLSAIIRDFKKFTAQQIIKAIQEEPESRRDWLLAEMLKAGESNSKKQTYQLWRNDNHPIELSNNEVINQKTDYIHNNPVLEGIVVKAEDYLYSSARDFVGEEGLLEVEKF
ncbi:MAG: transposase [Flavobacteriales bacterium]|nr:MAG: transposase [Flavobacteriales bacterium]